MASTRGGMRRILKRRLPVHEYIQRAVETGVYRSNDELEAVRRERRDGADDLRTIMRRFRQDVVRGSSVHDYPVEHRILKQHPPIPDPPRVPRRIARRMVEPDNPAGRLAKKILDRRERAQNKNDRQGRFGGGGGEAGRSSSSPGAASIGDDERYRRLFGLSSSSPSSLIDPGAAMGQKPAELQRAYAAAVKCLQLQRTEGGLTEDEAVGRVDEMLAEQDKRERERSARQRDLAVELSEERERRRQKEGEQQKDKRSADAAASSPPNPDGGAAPSSASSSSSSSSSSSPPPPSSSAIFAGNPRAAEGMMVWGERLQRVPYPQWTVGASTALDHWIARQVLGLSEESWQLLLEGGGAHGDPSLLSVGRDVVRVREALFPETMPPSPLRSPSSAPVEGEEEGPGAADDDLPEGGVASASSSSPAGGEEEESIEELLASLGGLRLPPILAGLEGSKQLPQKGSLGGRRGNVGDEAEEEEGDAIDLDRRVDALVDELQEWRRKNEERPYRDWPRQDRDAFDSWMRGYVRAVSPSSMSSEGAVDYESTRDALLSRPPLPGRGDSDAFWSRLGDDRDAVGLLDAMRRDGPPPGATHLHASFWDLPYGAQLDRLLNLGAVRPLADEYARESDRERFLRRHGDTLLEGVELEHLVPDPAGPIRAADLGPLVASASAASASGGGGGWRVRSDERFRIELIPYRSSPSDLPARERTRALFALWNQHKAGRARYEEKLFRTGRLGLRYGDDAGDGDGPPRDGDEEEDDDGDSHPARGDNDGGSKDK
jgi:hypothetical protein